ncbi:MAG: hypothetical protein KC910_26040 [Candidatus Eremiobacteraeota bacterium]|nr:hypothetical protein [Candidatus Eremiobacteraeota bacterium]
MYWPTRVRPGPSRVRLALASIPAEVARALVLDLTNVDLDAGQLQVLSKWLGISPPPERPQVLVYWVDDAGTHAFWQQQPEVAGESLADDPQLIQAQDSAGGFFLQTFPRVRLWASFDPQDDLLVGRWHLAGEVPPGLPRGSLNLGTLQFFTGDSELVGLLDVSALARHNPKLVEQLQAEFSRWGIDLEQDLMSLLAGEVAFSVAERPDRLDDLQEMPVEVVAALNDPGAAERLVGRLLPSVVTTSLPTFYREGVAIRQSLDQRFAFALVSDFVVFGLNLGADGLGEAISARIAETSLADQPAAKVLKADLSPEDGCLVALVERFGPLRCYAAGGPGQKQFEGPVVLEWIRPVKSGDAR